MCKITLIRIQVWIQLGQNSGTGSKINVFGSIKLPGNESFFYITYRYLLRLKVCSNILYYYYYIIKQFSFFPFLNLGFNFVLRQGPINKRNPIKGIVVKIIIPVFSLKHEAKKEENRDHNVGVEPEPGLSKWCYGDGYLA